MLGKRKLYQNSFYYQALQNKIETLFDILNVNNYESSLNDNTIRIHLRKDLGMLPSNIETQATTIGNVQAMMIG